MGGINMGKAVQGLSAESKRLLDIKAASVYMGISPNTLYQWVSQRRFPFVKVGRLTRFDIRQLDLWIERNAVKII
jgi:excisionase family DNA binding protein